MHARRCLTLAAGLLVCSLAPVIAADADQKALDEQVLKNAKLKTDGESLLNFLRRRILVEGDRAKVQALIEQLGAESFRVRAQAEADLIARGPVIVEMLKAALKNADLEVVRRAEKCLQRIQELDYAVDVPAAAVRLLALAKPAGAVQVLLDFIPFAGNDVVEDEVRTALASLAVSNGKADKTLVASLGDKAPLRRAVAAEALCRAGAAEHLAAVRKLLHDPVPSVRFRVALVLALAKEREAIPVLIDALPQVTLAQAWQAEDIFYGIAPAGSKLPTVSLGASDAGRKKCRDAWAAWWKENSAKVDLAKLKLRPRLLGYTLVVLLDQGQLVELNSDNQPRWLVDGLSYPLDVQMLPNQHVLVAEYPHYSVPQARQASRVTERNMKGEVVWEKRLVGPLVAQRLANGNTFMATDAMLIEVDPKGKELITLTLPGERIMKAAKAGEHFVCLTTEKRIVRLDAKGNEVHSFTLTNPDLTMKLFGGRLYVLPDGNVLVPHNAENKVVEYSSTGKKVWEVDVDQPIAAIRLANGNTLVTTMLPNRGAIEFDRDGNIVWSYKANTRVTRALRR
jgi:hypothetical protein